jgi:hypothetical protein
VLSTVISITVSFLILAPSAASAAEITRICADYASRAEGQQAFEADPQQLSHLDVNGDGIACEPFTDVQDYDGDGDIDAIDEGAASLIERGPAPTPRPTPELFIPPEERTLDDDIRLGLLRDVPPSTLYTFDSPLPVCDAIGFSVPQRGSEKLSTCRWIKRRIIGHATLQL